MALKCAVKVIYTCIVTLMKIKGRIANSNHATKTRLDIGSDPVVPRGALKSRLGPRSATIQNLLDETESSQLSMVDDCRNSY